MSWLNAASKLHPELLLVADSLVFTQTGLRLWILRILTLICQGSPCPKFTRYSPVVRALNTRF